MPQKRKPAKDPFFEPQPPGAASPITPRQAREARERARRDLAEVMSAPRPTGVPQPDLRFT